MRYNETPLKEGIEMINVIFDPAQITTVQAAVIGSFALVGVTLTTAGVVSVCATVVKKTFRSPIKTRN